MTEKTVTVDGNDLRKNIQKTLSELRGGFNPSNLTREEREELKSDIQNLEDLAHEILNKE